MSDEVFRANVTRNNIKNHIFDIGDYPMSKDEAEIVVKALNVYVNFLGFKSLLCKGNNDEITV